MFIYCIRNKVNGKCYIGQDSAPVEKLARAKTHFDAARNLLRGKQPKHKSKIVPAIAKYGEDAFEILILGTGYASKRELDAAEISFICQFDSIKNGYNIMPGGQGFAPNADINDPSVLQFMHELRSRGAKTANVKRWSNCSPEQKQEWISTMLEGRKNSDWQTNLRAYWSNLDPASRKVRSKQMKEGRPQRFVLHRDGNTVIETNLRSLLAVLSETPIAKKNIERIVRSTGEFNCDQFKIKKVAK